MLAQLTALKTILDSIDPLLLPLKFFYQENMPEQFPAGIILVGGTKDQIADSQFDLVTESFVIRVIFPDKSNSQATTKVATLMDAMKAEFRKDDHITLGGVAQHFRVTGTSPPYSSEAFGQIVRVFDIGVEVKRLEDTKL